MRTYSTVQAFVLSDDPEEKHDLAEELPGVVERLKQKLARYDRLAVPSQHPGVEPKSLPHNYGGIWTPGWCE